MLPKVKAVICTVNLAGLKFPDADRTAKTIVLVKPPSSSSIRLSSIEKDVSFRSLHQVNPAGSRLYDSVPHKAMDCTKLLSGMSPEFPADEQNDIYDAFEGVCERVSMLLLLVLCVYRAT